MRVAIYGAGNGGRIVFEAMKKSGIHVDFFIDEFFDKNEILGTSVLRISDIENKGDVDLYFTLGNGEVSKSDSSMLLTRELRNLGFNRVITWENFMWKFQDLYDVWYQKNWCNVDYDAFLMKHGYLFDSYANADYSNDYVNDLFSSLSDKESVDILGKVIDLRKNLKIGPLLDLPDQTRIYFPESIDVFRNIKNLKFVDCGGYDGDTMRNVMLLSKPPVSHVFSFEPEPKCFAILQDTAAELRREYPDTSFVTYSSGVWSENDIYYLDNNTEYCATLASGKKNTVSIPVLSLDSVLSKIPPNFIKMDIEGAEEGALNGARKIIENYHPTLAISIYHKANDLWEIPLLIKSFYPHYEMYLRHHHWSPWETVLYCVAPEGAVDV